MLFKNKNYELKGNLFYNRNPNTYSNNFINTNKAKIFYDYKITDNKAILLNLQNSNSIISKFKKKIGYNKNVLEVGCESGQVSFFFSIGTNNKIFGLDANLDSLKIANKFAKENNLQNVKFINADIYEDIFNDEVFDFIWCNDYLHHKENPKAAFKILSKSLKKDGYIILAMHDKFGRIRTAIRKYFFNIFGKNTKNKINSWTHNQNLHPYESYNKIEELLNWFEINGIEFINSTKSFNFTNDESFDNLFKKTARSSFFSRIVNQTLMIFNHYDRERDIFFLIGKKL